MNKKASPIPPIFEDHEWAEYREKQWDSKSYSEKLKSPKWQKRRLQTFERDQWRCRLCGDYSKTLHVHHLGYSGQPWDVHPNVLLTLCHDCHEGEEYNKQEASNYIVNSLGLAGFHGNWFVELRDALKSLNCDMDNPRAIIDFVKSLSNGKEIR